LFQSRKHVTHSHTHTHTHLILDCPRTALEMAERRTKPSNTKQESREKEGNGEKWREKRANGKEKHGLWEEK